MARLVKRVEDATWYVPEIEGNRDDSDPFMVLLSPLSGAEMRRLEQSGMGKITKGRGQFNFMKRAQEIQEKLIKERVLEVKNYSVVDPNGSTFTPTDGTELLQAILYAPPSEAEILEDILDALKDSSRLDEGILGNLKLQSDSPQVETKLPGSGAAQDAKTSREVTASAS